MRNLIIIASGYRTVISFAEEGVHCITETAAGLVPVN
jgi:hypothetical protein